MRDGRRSDPPPDPAATRGGDPLSRAGPEGLSCVPPDERRAAGADVCAPRRRDERDWTEPEGRSGGGRSAGRTRLIAGVLALMAVWSGLVFGLFLADLRSFWTPVLDSLATAGLCVLTLYAFWLLGWRIRGRFARQDSQADPLESSLIEIAIGLGTVMALVFAAGVVGWLEPAVAWAIVLAPLAGGHRRFLRELDRRRRAIGRSSSPGLAAAILAAVALLTLAASLAPPTSQDALVYHLAVPARHIEAGRIHHVEGNFYSAFPMNVELLFTLGLLLRGPALAKWYHWLLGAAAAACVAALSRRVAPAGGRPGTRSALAAAIFASMPSVALLAGWAYVDLGVVFFSTLSVLLFLRFWRRQHRRGDESLRGAATADLSLAALMAGIAAGCKYTAGLQGLLLAGFVVLVGRREGRSWRLIAGQLASVSAIAAAAAAPWWIKNLIETGNPLFPFAYSIFGGLDWDAERASVLAASLSEWGGGRSGWEILTLPWDVSLSARFFSQESFDGMIGCAFLIGAPLILLGLATTEEYRIAFVFLLLSGLAWILTTHQIRFLLPALAIASALLCASTASFPQGLARRATLGLIHAALVFNVLLISLHFAAHNPLRVVLGLESEESYLQREVPGGDYAVFAYIDRHLPLESRLLFGSCGNPGFLCRRPYRSDALFENRTLALYLRESQSDGDLHRRLAAEGFTHILFRFDCVFDPSGRKSEIPLEDQKKLAGFLNARARLVIEAGGTYLYELMPSP
ncbi:MAG: hypothetical protein JXA90_17300 [Planctomycetes bacterium]|nr:hypothetical protein [Planctomycetota bacterium]